MNQIPIRIMKQTAFWREKKTESIYHVSFINGNHTQQDRKEGQD